MLRALSVCAVLFLFATPTPAADFYIDPVHGDPAGDGSGEKPWRSLQEVFEKGLVESQTWDTLPYNAERRLVAKNADAPVKAGDTLWLKSGDYGDLAIDGYYNRGVITIAAAPGETPRFYSVRARSGAHWALKGLHVSPEFGSGERPRAMVSVESHGWRGPIHDVTVEDCDLKSTEDSSTWSAEQWNELSVNGIEADGARIVIRRNRLKNVDFGISVGAEHSLVEHNVVENFAGDGLRGLGNHTVFQYNVVKNCYDVNANHDDGFQSWSRGPGGVGTGEVVGIVLRGNTIINYVDPAQPHRGTLQGIGCFDGMFVDWVVENNVIITDHWHGITLSGARNCRIVNNTVIDENDQRPGPAGIRVGKHKRGMESSGCVVRNNLVTSLNIERGSEMTVDHNLVIEDRTAPFVDAGRFDLRLRKGSAAIDAGSGELAPGKDVLDVARPQGAGVDVGAYEYKVE